MQDHQGPGTGVLGTSRRRLAVAGLICAGILAPLLAGAGIGPAKIGRAPAATPGQPNILVIETDDQTVEQMRVMNNVNSLIGSQGARFSNSFVNFSLCCPSRATFLTGQYAHNHDVWSNQPPNGGFNRFQSLHGDNNLAIWLQEAGYHTAMIGKYLNGYVNQPLVPPGWSEWHAASPNAYGVYDYQLNDNGALTRYGTDPSDFKQDVLTGEALDFINRRAKGTPFFLWLNYTSPHIGGPNPNPNPPADCAGAPKPAPRHAHAFDNAAAPRTANFNEADVSDKPGAVRNLPLLSSSQITDIRRRYRCQLESLLSVDEGVQQMIEALGGRGALDETLIIYTSDNGYFHGEHRIRTEKQRVYEESIRVPLMMRGPGIPAGAMVDDLVTNADLAPTIADAAGVTPRVAVDGRPLIPLAQQPGLERNRQLLIEQPNLAAIRTPRYLYAEYNTGERELYDLQRDPFELQSRQKDPAYAAVRATLTNRLHQLESCSGPSCRPHQPDPAPG
jgi:arylsulfatase A-like enzyme